MNQPLQHIVLIGSGNLATQLGLALHRRGLHIVQVYSRTKEAAKTLAEQLNAPFTTNLGELVPTADLYIYALKDDVLAEVINTVSVTQGLHVHTAGSMPMSLFVKKQLNYGVFYPLQTFSKEKTVDFTNIPVFITANSTENADKLTVISKRVAEKVFVITDEQREFIHLSAVFACNFTNHLYAIAEKILAEQDLPFEPLIPLITETLEKAKTLSPSQSQTGPAQRGDQVVISKHLQLLKQHPEWQELYKQLTQSIEQTKND
ncbi:MAG TPA: DUF2520 domain-containing protein [Paludibacteraceae bacterium]|nr:DUF2520 domain-containing protein [Paludibacteraceae bacterium]